MALGREYDSGAEKLARILDMRGLLCLLVTVGGSKDERYVATLWASSSLGILDAKICFCCFRLFVKVGSEVWH